jgi:hypothetical protein
LTEQSDIVLAKKILEIEKEYFQSKENLKNSLRLSEEQIAKEKEAKLAALATYQDEDSCLFANLCLDTLHSTTLFMGYNGPSRVYKNPVKVEDSYFIFLIFKIL